MSIKTIETSVLRSKANVLRLALTGALAAGIFYIICWLGAFLPIGSAPHMYIALFTNAEMTSSVALIQGLSWSIVFGLIAGTLISLIYNVLAPLERS